MSNLIIWSHQATVDYNYRVRDVLSEIAGKILREKLLQSPIEHEQAQRVREVLEQARGRAFVRDRKITVSSLDNVLEALMEIRTWLQEGKLENGQRYKPDIQIGGDPAIAAIRGHMLSRGPARTDLPDVCYAGMFPKSVEAVLEQNLINDAQEILRNVFRSPLRYPVDAEPHSVGLEADVAKIIFVYGPGRSIARLAPEGHFTQFLNSIEQEVETAPQKERVVLAVGTGRPSMVHIQSQSVFDELASIANEASHDELVDPEKQEVSEMLFLMRLLKDVKATKFGDRVRTFVATRDFGRDEIFTRQVIALLKNADIISLNDAEIDDLHTAVNGGNYHNIPLAYKLRELPFKAIKVCHSPAGVIMDLGTRPEHIITSDRFQEDPAKFLEEVLRLSADGATYAMDATAGLGRWANEAMIRIYSRNVREESRQHNRFCATFLDVDAPMPAGMISVACARVVRTLGAVVGLGAVFDGLLLAFLMRD
jgi:hypothetical protein